MDSYEDDLAIPDGNQVALDLGLQDTIGSQAAELELNAVEFLSGWADIDNEGALASPETSSPGRKVRSAEPVVGDFSGPDKNAEYPRPYTAAGVDALPPSRGISSRSRKKRNSAVKKTAELTLDTHSPCDDRPRSAEVNEWGDFDTDRLLRDPDEEQIRSNQTALDPLDGQRSKSRKSRRSTPLKTSPRPNPWDGYLTFEPEKKEPVRTQMQKSIELLSLELPTPTSVRQKPIETLSLELSTPGYQQSSRTGTAPKPLLGRVTIEKIKSSRSRPTTSYMTRPGTPAPLFGMEILPTIENRAAIFERLAPLWPLISCHPLRSSSEHSLSGSASVDDRSPYECSLTMVKICKAVGISMTASSATHLSFWYANEEGVAFEAFCDLVIQGAIQPALHHFHLDQSLGEYLSSLNIIVQSLLTTSIRSSGENSTVLDGPLRLRELDEIESIFPNWRKRIAPQSAAPVDMSAVPARDLMTTERVRRAVEASASQRMLAHKLPLEEARVTHVENIRRKVQLHKSWKFISDGKIMDRGGLRSSQSVQMIHGSTSTPNTEERSDSRTIRREIVHKAVHPTPEIHLISEGARSGLVAEKPQANNTTEVPPPVDDVVLVCCSCSVRGAELWCSACFTVNCQKCWQDFHSCTVDMALVESATTTCLVGPAALAIKRRAPGNTAISPPVGMIYLPTKAMVSGKLAKGNSIIRHRNAVAGRKNSNQASASGDSRQIDGVLAKAILPSLQKSKSDGSMLRRKHLPLVENATTSSTTCTPTTESTADLVKSLMLRMSPSTPTTGSRPTVDSMTKMLRHHPLVRQNLHLAPVSLDAGMLLPQS